MNAKMTSMDDETATVFDKTAPMFGTLFLHLVVQSVAPEILLGLFGSNATEQQAGHEVRADGQRAVTS